MITAVKQGLWSQFGASIDMLKNAIAMWPEESWTADRRFFYMAYHALVFLDYYLTIPAPKSFASPLSFTLAESGVKVEGMIDDVMPDRIYTRKELLDYLQKTRAKCHDVIAGLSEGQLSERWIEYDGGKISKDLSVLEILLYNMRHVQHHAAQLNTMLRNKINDAPRWVRTAQ